MPTIVIEKADVMETKERYGFTDDELPRAVAVTAHEIQYPGVEVPEDFIVAAMNGHVSAPMPHCLLAQTVRHWGEIIPVLADRDCTVVEEILEFNYGYAPRAEVRRTADGFFWMTRTADIRPSFEAFAEMPVITGIRYALFVECDNDGDVAGRVRFNDSLYRTPEEAVNFALTRKNPAQEFEIHPVNVDANGDVVIPRVGLRMTETGKIRMKKTTFTELNPDKVTYYAIKIQPPML